MSEISLMLFIFFMRKLFITILISVTLCAQGQYSNRAWCFGDSAGVDFTIPSSPTLFSCGMDCRGTCCSIADSSHNLLFYAHTMNLYGAPTFLHGAVRNKLHQIMSNGDSLIGEGWYNEMVVIPHSSQSGFFFLFHIGCSLIPGIHFSLIDITANGGLGTVQLKNILLQNFYCLSSTAAIKHGNGRDWWVIFKQSGVQSPNNSYYEYLISPAGIAGPYIYSLGSVSTTDLGQFNFNHKGDKMAYTDLRSIVEIYDFDRCTGVISNAVNINPQNLNPPTLTWGLEFSPNDSLLYISSMYPVPTLMQLDLYQSNVWQNRDTIGHLTGVPAEGGFIKLAPDGKIYWSCAYTPGGFNYPYDSSEYNMHNMNLSVINSPDSLGAACNFTPFSFYLGGKRTYYGLPNNPDYNLGAWVGSPCDTLWSGISNPAEEGILPTLQASYIGNWQKLFINAQNIKGKNCVLQIFDVNGQKVFHIEKTTVPPYFTQDVNCAGFTDGMYIVLFRTEKEVLKGKFVKE